MECSSRLPSFGCFEPLLGLFRAKNGCFRPKTAQIREGTSRLGKVRVKGTKWCIHVVEGAKLGQNGLKTG